MAVQSLVLYLIIVIFNSFMMNKLKVEKSDASLRREAKSTHIAMCDSTSNSESELPPESIVVPFDDTITDVPMVIPTAGDSADSDPEDSGTPFHGDLEDLGLRIGDRWLNCDSSDSNSDCESELSSNSIEHGLGQWAVTHHIPLSAMGDLLTILRPHLPSLPKDPRTLLKTPSIYNVKQISGGQYSHVGLERGLSQHQLLYCSSGYLLKLFY